MEDRAIIETKTREYNLTVRVNNFNLSYNDVGEGHTPIIFLHGYPFDKTMWNYQLEFFKSSCRLIACDIRGFGRSKDEESFLNIDLFANDLIAFMDTLGIQKAIVCGFSMGGYIALNAQQRFPDRFTGLILCGTQCIADTNFARESRYKSIDEIKVNGVADFNEGFIKKVFHKDSLANKPELVDEVRSIIFSNSQHIISQGLVALAKRTETCSTLRKISVPTLIICGREDQVTPLAQSEFMNKQIIESRLRVIDNAGHLSNLEQPDIFNGHLRNFLICLDDMR